MPSIHFHITPNAPRPRTDIKKFACDNYKATFPLMSKVDVNGAGADPLFQFLKEKKGGLMGDDVSTCDVYK